MTLDQLAPGQKAVLRELPEGIIRSQAIRLGLMPGTEIVCVHKLNKGPVIIRKNYQQIAVGEALATQITIKKHSEEVAKSGESPDRWS